MREGAVLAGRYDLGAEIGRGSTATVHRARDRTTGQDVAVKLFTAAPSPADGGRDRREVDILRGLRHPGLVAFRDAGTADVHRYVVTDLVDGPSLGDVLQGASLTPQEVADLGAALAEALAHVHERGVVHRDVKPANILLDPTGRPRLADFGIARLCGATRVTATGVVVGTAAYMAPEQVLGRDVGAPADVYSLGLVLLEALTGNREYPGPPVEAAVARLHRPPRVPGAQAPGLAAVLRRMTAIEAGPRPTATEVAALLRAPVQPARPAGRSTLRQLLPLAAVAVLISGLATGHTLSLSASEDAATQAAPPAALVPAGSAPSPGAADPAATAPGSAARAAVPGAGTAAEPVDTGTSTGVDPAPSPVGPAPAGEAGATLAVRAAAPAASPAAVDTAEPAEDDSGKGNKGADKEPEPDKGGKGTSGKGNGNPGKGSGNSSAKSGKG